MADRDARRLWRAPLGWLAMIGPEMVSGASDNDPTNVGTAAVVGAQTGYQLSWVALLIAPLLAVVQTIAAHVGVIAGSDLQTLTARRYGRRVATVLMVSVVVVNVVTIAADLQAGAAGIGLLTGVDPRLVVLPLGLALVSLLLIGKYDEMVAVLRYLLIGLVAFAVSAVLAHPDWSALLKDSMVPRLSLRSAELGGSLALVGTTLTAYVFVWETVERGVEEPARGGPGKAAVRPARVGAVLGAVFTALIFWSMLVACAATLGRHHQAVVTAQEAARALRPLAGSLAADLFGAGLAISAVVALPVMMATTAHVVGAQFDWRRGLSEGIGRAGGFYAVLVASIALAVVVALSGVSVLGMLVVASIIGGLGTPIGVALLVLVARDTEIMGGQVISGRLAIAGWAVVVLVGALGLIYLADSVFASR